MSYWEAKGGGVVRLWLWISPPKPVAIFPSRSFPATGLFIAGTQGDTHHCSGCLPFLPTGFGGGGGGCGVVLQTPHSASLCLIGWIVKSERYSNNK